MQTKDIRGFRTVLQLPDADQLAALGVTWPAFAAGVAEYQCLNADLFGAERRQADLISGKTDAVAADRAALAQAIRDGKADPGQGILERHGKAIAAATRRREALELAVEGAAQDLGNVTAAERDSRLIEGAELVATARARYVAAIEAMAGARAHLAATLGWVAFVRDFPDRTLAYRSGGRGDIAGLIGLSGDAMPVGRVLDALRADAQP